MNDLATWLHEQITADETSTRRLLYWAQQTILTLQDPKLLGKQIPGWHDWPEVEKMCQQRLVELDAKRRILNDVLPKINTLQGACDEEWGCRPEVDAADLLLQVLALPFANQPGYRDGWRPEVAHG